MGTGEECTRWHLGHDVIGRPTVGVEEIDLETTPSANRLGLNFRGYPVDRPRLESDSLAQKEALLSPVELFELRCSLPYLQPLRLGQLHDWWECS